MTPGGWITEDFALFGAAWMFGGVLIALAVGALVGRLRGAEAGIGSGMLLWALGNLAVSAMTATYLYLDSQLMTLPVTRCEPSADARGEPYRQLFHALAAAGAPAREVRTPPAGGLCPEDAAATSSLRIRRDALASAAAIIDAEPQDDEGGLVIMVVWAVFGGFGLLFALLMLSFGPSRRPATPPPAWDPRTVPAWRLNIGKLLGQLGGLVFVAAFVGPFLLAGSENRAVQFALRAVAAAVGCWLLAALLARGIRATGVAMMVVIGSMLLGAAELVRITG